VLSVLTIAAPCLPRLTDDKKQFADENVLKDLREKILLTLRMAAHNGVTNLVLGAMGCGAYRCPPGVVAEEMKRAIEMEEFRGWFESLNFAVYAAGQIGQRNLEVFKAVFEQE
jgi:uncharacterized protein (TIGR02452 family)